MARSIDQQWWNDHAYYSKGNSNSDHYSALWQILYTSRLRGTSENITVEGTICS